MKVNQAVGAAGSPRHNLNVRHQNQEGYAAISSSNRADESKGEALTAKQILDKMEKAYLTCKSYCDSGIVTTVFIKPGGRWVREKPFKTAFIRPNRFRFEFCEKVGCRRKHKYIVYRKGKAVQTWWDIKPGVEKPGSLGLAIAGATGVSGGAAHTIPNLLLPNEVGGRGLTALSEAKRIAPGKHAKVVCFRIQAKYADSPVVLWIDKQFFLVRRIDAKHKWADCRTEVTTTYAPVINGEIPAMMLEFGSPRAKSRRTTA